MKIIKIHIVVDYKDRDRPPASATSAATNKLIAEKIIFRVDLEPEKSDNFFFYTYNLQVFKQKVCSDHLLIYLDVPGSPVKKAIPK